MRVEAQIVGRGIVCIRDAAPCDHVLNGTKIVVVEPRLVALPSLEGWLYFALISPIFVFIQLTRISGVSLLEARGRKQWKGNEEYQRYLNKTSILIPMPPKKI